MGKTPKQPYYYPESAKDDISDDYFGTEVPDPYRWLEDDMSEETTEWVKAQNKVTFNYLKEIPFRDSLKDRMTEIWNYPKMGIPSKEGHYFVYNYNTGLQNQDILYFKKDLHEEGRVLLDPNTFSEDGTASLSAFRVSNNSKYVAYGISRGGSDWNELYIKEIESGKIYNDQLKWVKFSGIAWYKEGFFYTKYKEPKKGDELKGENKHASVYYHRVGTPQSKDLLIRKDDAHPERGFHMEVTDDERFMLLYVTESTSGNSLAFQKSELGSSGFTWLADGFVSDYHVIGNDNNMLFILTNL